MKVIKFKSNKKIIEEMNKDNDIKLMVNLFEGVKVLLVPLTEENIDLLNEDCHEVLKRKKFLVISDEPDKMMMLLGTKNFTYMTLPKVRDRYDK